MKTITKTLRFGLLPVLMTFIVSLIVLSIVQVTLDIGSDGTISTEESVLLTFIQFVSMMITIYIILVRNKRICEIIHKPNMGLNKLVIPVFAGLVGLFIAQGSIGILSQLIGYETAENSVVQDGDRLLSLALVPIMFLLVSPVEEILFRGILQGFIREMYNKNIAILVASSLFGLVHIVSIVSVSLASLLISILGISILGIILGYIYEKYQNILIPILIHGIYNSILVIVQFLII